MKYSFPVLLALIAIPAIAENARVLDAHEHGVGELNIAVDGKTVAMEFHKPLDLFVPTAAAECSVIQAGAALESEEKHDEHDHEKHSEHEAHKDHDDHAKADASHTEFHAKYTLTCGNPDALAGIDFPYFEAFENALELEVQIVTTSGAQAFEVERDRPMLDLRGVF